MALTTTNPALLQAGSDRAFRVFLHEFLAFASRLEAIRTGFATRLKLSGAAYTTLIALAQLERDQAEIGVTALAEHLHVSAAFVTTEIGALTRRRLVQKRPHPRDGRRVILGLTPRGQALLASLLPVQAPVNNALFASLDAASFQHLAALLPRLIADADHALALLKEPAP